MLIMVSLAAGCDIFDTRDAEGPSEAKSHFVQPVDPSDVIANLISSLEDKNVENYLLCFSDSAFSGKSFRFSPSAGAAAQFPQLASMWNKEHERQYFNNLMTRIPDDARISLEISNNNFSQLTDSAIFTATYTLNVPQNDTNIPVNYQGELRFSIIRDARSLWSIYFWLDIKKDDEPSWSELKGRLYN